MCFGGEGTKRKSFVGRRRLLFYRMYTSVFDRKLEYLSLETILTVLYTIHHILVQIARPCLSSIFATFLHVSVPFELTPLSRGRVWYGAALH